MGRKGRGRALPQRCGGTYSGCTEKFSPLCHAVDFTEHQHLFSAAVVGWSSMHQQALARSRKPEEVKKPKENGLPKASPVLGLVLKNMEQKGKNTNPHSRLRRTSASIFIQGFSPSFLLCWLSQVMQSICSPLAPDGHIIHPPLLTAFLPSPGEALVNVAVLI